MIEITAINTIAPRAVEKARRTKPFVTKLNDDSYKVVPRRIAKQKRVVTFRLVGGRRFAQCRDLHTGESCPAVENDKVCYHIAAAARRAESNRRRKLARRCQASAPQQVMRLAVTDPQPAQPLPTWINATRIRGIRI